MRYSFIYLLFILFLPSCENESRTPVTFQPRLTAISSESYYSTLMYDKKGRVTEWYYADNTFDISFNTFDISFNVTYQYDPKAQSILVVSDNKMEQIQRLHDEVIHFNDGKAIRAEGLFRYIEAPNYDRVYMKEYTVDFSYDSNNHLSLINVEEYRVNSSGWKDKTVYKSKIEFKWENDCLIDQYDYLWTETPTHVTKYTYYPEPAYSFNPLFSISIWNDYYSPLFYTGFFGNTPTRLIKTITRSTPHTGDETESLFAYHFSQDTYRPLVESYTRTAAGRTSAYYLTWQLAE